MTYFDLMRLQAYFPESEVGALDAPYYLPAGSTAQEEIREDLENGYFRVVGYASSATIFDRTEYYVELGLGYPILSGLNP